MATFNLFGMGQRGKSTSISAQRRINCYVEPQQDPEKGPLALIGTPGLTLKANLGGSPSRGMWAYGNFFYSVHGSGLWKINNAGVATNVGTLLTSTGDVSMADNALGNQLCIVDGTYGYIYNVVTNTFTHITDVGFPANPGTVTFLDTYFIVTVAGTNQFNVSTSATGLTWPATFLAFTESNAGPLQAVLADHSLLCLFGDTYTEFWQDTGAIDFPYARIPGAVTEFGLQSPWSLAKFNGNVVGLFRNKMGEAFIGQLDGMKVTPLSTPDVDFLINGYVNTANAVGFAYRLGGHPMYQISFPDAATTWLYDGLSRAWSELQSAGLTRHRANKFTWFLNQRIVSDYANGLLYTIDPANYTENGASFNMELWSRHVWDSDKQVSLPWLQLDFEQGVGLANGQGSNPQVMLSLSKNGGKTFGPEQWRSLGKIGEYTARSTWTRLGKARDMVFRAVISDPVKRVLTGATLEATEGTS